MDVEASLAEVEDDDEVEDGDVEVGREGKSWPVESGVFVACR